MSKFQRKVYNTVSQSTIMVDADLAHCERCGKVATSLMPIADSYGEYDTDIFVCNSHNPFRQDLSSTVREVSQEELKANLTLMERGFIL